MPKDIHYIIDESILRLPVQDYDGSIVTLLLLSFLFILSLKV